LLGKSELHHCPSDILGSNTWAAYLQRMAREKLKQEPERANAVTYQLSPLLPSISMSTKKAIDKKYIYINTLLPMPVVDIKQKPREEDKNLRWDAWERLLTKQGEAVRNTDIRNTIGITSSIENIEQQRMEWFGHLVRMQYDQLAVHACNCQCSGYKARGRPRKRWIDCVTETCSNMDYELERQPFSPIKENYICLWRLTTQVDRKKESK